MKPIFIVGPTASGKTDLALSLVPFLKTMTSVTGVDILSADSKQVYVGEDIVTGKDKDKYKGVSVSGIDVVSPNEVWSLACFLAYAKKVLLQAQAKQRMVLIVGGTGQYLTSLMAPPATVSISQNKKLRKELGTLTVLQLQERLSAVDPQKLARMNQSDRHNPRRLIRAIEVAKASTAFSLAPSAKKNNLTNNALWLGLELSKPELEKRIRARVIARLEQGAIEETKNLSHKYPDWTAEAKAAIGYKEIMQFLKKEIDREQLITLWTLHELQYSKRQMAWFKKISSLHWFPAQDPKLLTQVEEVIRNWYTKEQL